MSPLKSGLLTFLVTMSVVAKAQVLLSFEQCIKLVTQNNAEIRAAEETVQSSLYQVDSFRGAYYPQITGNIGYLQSGPGSLAGSTTGNTYSASLNATQNLFNGFIDSSKVEQAQAQSHVAKAALQITKSKVSFDLKVTFANLLYAKETEKVAMDFKNRRQENFRMVELRFESGRENKGSLLLSQAYLKQSIVDVLKAQHSRETSQSDLKKALGNDSDESLDIREDIPLKEPPVTEPDYKKIIPTNPSYAQSQAQVQIQEASLTAARSGFYPTLNLTGSTGKYADHFFPDNDHWSLGVNFSWPLFNGGKDYHSTRSVTANLYAAKSNLTHLERNQLSVLKKAYTSYVEAVEDLKVNEAFLQAAKTRAEIARAKYNNGLLTFDEWDIIENDLINKTKLYLLSKRDRITAEAAWEQAQGIGVIP